MTVKFIKATKEQARLRLALIGPSGSGKTYTALRIAAALRDGGRIALIDTERGSASKYADLFDFDTLALSEFSPERYIEAIAAAQAAKFAVLIIDSLSHAWAGKGGILEYVDQETARSRSHNAYSEGWRKATPLHNSLVDAIIQADLHVIATMRTKTEYVMEKDEKTGKTAPRKIGLAPVQREGLDYEFDVVGDIDNDHRLIIGKTRCPALTDKVYTLAGEDVAAVLKMWLSSGGIPASHGHGPDWSLETVKAGEEPPPAEAPKPAPAPAKKVTGRDEPKRAKINTGKWSEALLRLDSITDYYRDGGTKINPYHALAAAYKEGYHEITDANVIDVLDALVAYAQGQRAAQAEMDAETAEVIMADAAELPDADATWRDIYNPDEGDK